MINHCGNPSCGNPLHHLREGRSLFLIYRINTPVCCSQEAAPAGCNTFGFAGTVGTMVMEQTGEMQIRVAVKSRSCKRKRRIF